MSIAAAPLTMFSANKTEASRQMAVLLIVLATYLMILLDTSIVITGLPEIQKDFGFSASALSWVQNAYTLFFGSLLMVGARAGDLFGRKRVFQMGVLIFTVSSLVIGMAQTGLLLVIARAVQGIGAAILAPATMALLTTHFSEGEPRTKALSAYAATAGIGASLGLVLGGFFAGAISWRVGFLVNVPVGIALWVAARSLLADSGRHDGQLDYVCAALSTLGMGGLVYGIVASSDGWMKLHIIGSVIAGVVLIAAFFLRQARASSPLLPLTLFNDRSRAAAYLARMLFIGSMVSFFFYTTQLMQVILGMTPFMAGLGFLPMTATTFIASLLVPLGTRKLGNGAVLALALVLAAIGLLLLSTLGQSGGFLTHIALPMLLIGLGNGAALGPLTIAGMKSVDRANAGAASGVVNTAHQLGGTLGLAIIVALAAQLSNGLAAHVATGFSIAAGFQVVALLITATYLLRGR